jgi:hypothetical protein
LGEGALREAADEIKSVGCLVESAGDNPGDEEIGMMGRPEIDTQRRRATATLANQRAALSWKIGGSMGQTAEA